MMYQVEFASPTDEEELQAILWETDMGLAGDIQDHVVIKVAGKIIGGAMIVQMEQELFHILVFGIRKDKQKQGAGSVLLSKLCETPWEYCRDTADLAEAAYRITTVAKGASAGFYAKCGFKYCTFAELSYPFNEQCKGCPKADSCNSSAMLFAAGRRSGSI